jgi:leucyl aminopeptidase
MMKISVNSISEKEIGADILVLPVYEGGPADFYKDVDVAMGKIIKRLLDAKDFKGANGQTMIIPVSGIKSQRLLLVGLGKRDELTAEKTRRAGSKAFAAIRSCGLAQVALSARSMNGLSGSSFRMKPVFYFLEGGMLGSYRFEKYITKHKKEEPKKEIYELTVLGEDGGIDVLWLKALVSATYFARDLVNTPSNDMTPPAIAKIARNLAGGKLKVTVLEGRAIEREKMGAYLSVAKGSNQPPQFIIAEYKGSKDLPVVLIGKTVTFDSGGLDIKPGEGMEKMKYDMAGGAAVLAVIRAAADMKLPVNLVAILPAVENLISGSASRPGDVATTISGRTVEIISTDAEGRMTLADAIGYAIKHKNPKAMIDIATLTGACNFAFGNETIAMMGTDAALMDKLKAASEEAYERVWPMPLFEEYGDYLKSDIADIKNVGGRKAALCSSAYFLREFAGNTPWVHLDIAGAAWNDTDRPYGPKGASGIGVRLLLYFLRNSLS